MTTRPPERRLLTFPVILAMACSSDDIPATQDTDASATTSMTASTSSTTDGSSTLGADDGSTTTGPMPCMGNEDCTNSGAPFCEPISGECDGTADPDRACAGLDVEGADYAGADIPQP